MPALASEKWQEKGPEVSQGGGGETSLGHNDVRGDSAMHSVLKAWEMWHTRWLTGRLDCDGSRVLRVLGLEPPGSRTASCALFCLLLERPKGRCKGLSSLQFIITGEHCQPVHRLTRERSSWFLKQWQLEVICGHQF